MSQGLDECVKLLRMAKAGKYNGYLLEGMACRAVVLTGAGTNQQSRQILQWRFSKARKNRAFEGAVDTPFIRPSCQHLKI